jgi:hypothetical protein
MGGHSLTGLPAYPDPQTLGRFLLRFAQHGLPAFRRLHDHLTVRRPQHPTPSPLVILDLDSTVLTVYGRRAGAKVGFNPREKGRPAYLPLLGIEGQARDGWKASSPWHSSRDDRDPAAAGASPGPGAPGVQSLRLRAASACCDHEIVAWLAAHTGRYAIAAALTPRLQRRVAAAR